MNIHELKSYVEIYLYKELNSKILTDHEKIKIYKNIFNNSEELKKAFLMGNIYDNTVYMLCEVYDIEEINEETKSIIKKICEKFIKKYNCFYNK